MLIYIPGSGNPIDERLIGGKAKNLALLQERFNVPPWFALTGEAFARVVGSGIRAEEAAALIETVHLPQDIRLELEEAAAALGLKAKLLAVRSSAVGEDGSAASFAGQLESLLYVPYDELEAAIKQVWASAFSERVRIYRRERAAGCEPLSVAVIVQAMVDAEVAGVAFSADPVTGDPDTAVISAVYGLGEGLVSGLLDADDYRVNAGGIWSEIACKTQMVVLDRDQGRRTRLVSVDDARQNAACLDPDRISALAVLVRRIGDYYGTPQDVEWAWAEGGWFILQARPVSTLVKRKSEGIRTIWDNSNIIESYAGVTTPLTFSFISQVYTEVYQEFCRIMGVEERIIRSNEAIFSMLGLIKGRVYYNLLNWYQVLSLLPGYSVNAAYMEQMMGVRERLAILPTVVHSRRNPYLRIAGLLIKMTRQWGSLPCQVRSFYQLLDESLLPYENRDLSVLKPPELIQAYRDLERKLLYQWHAPLVNDFFAMICYGVLKQLIVKWQLDTDGTLQNGLLTGEGDIISTRPVENVRNMANLICRDAGLRQAFSESAAAGQLAIIQSHPALNDAFQQHIAKFGIRCANELKLETVTYQHEPLRLVELLASYVRLGYCDPGENRLKEAKIRREAEEQVRRKLGRSPFRRWLFGWVLRQARLKVKNRENLRFERTRVFAAVREIFLALGSRLAGAGVLAETRDIFYLTQGEIFAFVQGTAVTANLRGLVAVRKQEFQEYQAEAPGDRFETFDWVYPDLKEEQPRTAPGPEILKGIGCSPGVVKAPVKVVCEPERVTGLEGCIMVAERTDPGWVPLFPLVKGILVERGSVLSHSAIVAREMGIPAIVAVAGITRRLKDGDFIEMNGSTGSIRILQGVADEA